MQSKNFLKEKLLKGQTVLGTWSIIPSVITTDIISSTSLDFIIIDSEHGPITYETAQKMVITAESQSVSPLFRVGSSHEVEILRALDIGAHGVQVPNITNLNAALDVVKYGKYPPVGIRGFSPFTRAGGYSHNTDAELTQHANEKTLLAINIEGKEALNEVDRILQIDNIDIIFVGLFDLSKSLDIPGQVNHPKVLENLAMLTDKIRSSGKYAGTIATSDETMKRFIDMGIQYLVYLVDCELLKSAYMGIKQKFDKYILN